MNRGEKGGATNRLLSRTADSLGEGEDTGAINVWMDPLMYNAQMTRTYPY